METKKAYLTMDLTLSIILFSIILLVFSLFISNINLWKSRLHTSMDMNYILQNHIEDDINLIEHSKHIDIESFNITITDANYKNIKSEDKYFIRRRLKILDEKFGLVEIEEIIKSSKKNKYIMNKTIKSYAIVGNSLN